MNPRWHTCNVVQSAEDRVQLWHFERSGSTPTLATEKSIAASDKLPPALVRKAWASLWRKRVNVAWLSAGEVFLRVIQVPKGEPSELPAMVEFQLEKVSPLPVNQIVWSFQALPLTEASGQQQSVIVLIADRKRVEAYLGGLEGNGYLADRLELPQLQHLLALESGRDATWVLVYREGQRLFALTAWWQRGLLAHVALGALAPGTEAASSLVEQLARMAWAGEMEGWLTEAPDWHLAAESHLASALEPALRAWTKTPIRLEALVDGPDLATLSARCGHAFNLVPAEFTARYRQQFIDRLWMRGLAAIGLLYVVGVIAYFVALEVLKFQKHTLDGQIQALTPDYQESQQLKAKVGIFQEQSNLRYAALNCWLAVSEALPTELTLSSVALSRGAQLTLFGAVPSDQQDKVTSFNEALGKYVLNGEAFSNSLPKLVFDNLPRDLFERPLFNAVETRSIQAQPGRPGQWSIDAKLNRVEPE